MAGPSSKSQGTSANVTSAPDVSQQDKDTVQQGGTINRKKQKRRAKEAAKRAQEQEHDQGSGDISTLPPLTAPNGQPLTAPGSFPDAHDEDEFPPATDGQSQSKSRREPGASEDDGIFVEQESQQPSKSKKKKKKAKSQIAQNGLDHGQYDPNHPSHPPSHQPLAVSKDKKSSEDRIWNTSSAQERERIKDFWLQLKEEQRRSLVKVEKDAVLKKMKEQQKHSCSCTVCGRKRAAIEDELEVLYDAYYRELEQFANHQHPDGTPRQLMPPPQRPLPLNTRSHQPHNHPPNIPPPERPIHTEPLDDEEEDDEDAEEVYDEDEGSQADDAYLEDEDYLNEPTGPGSEFYEFGNSLTVQNGILTVADDLMQNDGKKFIEMMEQLAERRMQREDDPQYPGVSFRHGRRTSAYPDDDVDSQDDGYGPSDDESYDEDEEDVETMATMTEDQRMEEGRRMFQIFAARMFEQRVLTAYREQIARERQEKLLQELDDDEKANTQRELKKAKEAQKRKEKKTKAKQAKEEDRARKEAEKAAAEAEAKAIEEAKAEEQRKRKEEQRKKKEAEKRAQDEEKQKREAEKQRKLQEAREQQAEAERKQRETKEREKKKREEAARKEREAKEAQEAEEARKREANKTDSADTLSKTSNAQQPTPAPPMAIPVPNLVSRKSNAGLAGSVGSNHTGPSPIASIASPRPQIATPVLPKAVLPVRSRQATQNLEPDTRPPPPGFVAARGTQPTSPANAVSESASHADATISRASPAQADPRSAQIRSTAYSPSQPTLSPGTTASTLSMHTPIGFTAPMNGQMSNLPPKLGLSDPPGLGGPPGVMGYKSNFTAPVVRMPPGINGIRAPASQSPTAGSAQMAPLSQGYGYDAMTQQSIDSTIHASNPPLPRTRHSIDSEAQLGSGFPRFSPISRPQPASIGHGRKTSTAKNDVSELTEQLGSSALIGDDDDDDEPLPSSKPAFYDHHSTRFPPTQPGMHRNGVPSSLLSTSVGQDSFGSLKHDALRSAPVGGHWSSHPPGFPSNPPVSGSWNSNQSFMKPSNFSMLPSGNVARPVLIRQLACQACRQLSSANPQSNGYHFIKAVLQVTQQLKPVEPPIEAHELLDIFDTEGNAQNGGGAFFVLDDPNGKFVRWTPENQTIQRRLPSNPGEIGSPVIGGPMPFGFGKQFGPPGGLPTPPGY